MRGSGSGSLDREEGGGEGAGERRKGGREEGDREGAGTRSSSKDLRKTRALLREVLLPQ